MFTEYQYMLLQDRTAREQDLAGGWPNAADTRGHPENPPCGPGWRAGSSPWR